LGLKKKKNIKSGNDGRGKFKKKRGTQKKGGNKKKILRTVGLDWSQRAYVGNYAPER